MDENDELRLYCLMRTDLKASTGKLITQGGHAFVGCVSVCPSLRFIEYLNDGQQPKITLRAKNEGILLRAVAECKEAGIPYYLVTDAGRTVFPVPTVTCLGIGPVARKDLPKFVQRLQLLDWILPDD